MKKILSSAPISQEQSLAFVRIITGLFMAYHGWEVFSPETMNGYLDWEPFKGGSGKTMVYIGKGSEFVIGVLLTLGLFTRFAALGLLISMLYIAFFIGNGKVWYEDQHPFMFVLLAVIYLSSGGGAWSLDRKLFG